ncbi:hypothetical protein JOD97_002298 [Duganella sp. 1411]|uniref:hypothetical protein n=1 Tax=Duganella sp. 1411 TaxID=2806572 RepID=UPI001AEA7441|nr:hypothetical protein [Duganella sp. 1411]MBP1204284.1 hypothetical protein [Duganella sp. 1411]
MKLATAPQKNPKMFKKSVPLGMLKAFFKALKAAKSDLYRTQWLPRLGATIPYRLT